MKVKVYGASDDLIEVVGDFNEEFNVYGDKDHYLAFSDGTMLKINYDGVWRIVPMVLGSAKYKKVFEAVSMDDDQYSDIIELEIQGDLLWCGIVDCFVKGRVK